MGSFDLFEEEMMSIRLLQVILVVFVLSFSVSLFASEIKELKAMGDLNVEGKRVDREDRILCVDDLKVFQTIAFGYGNGTGAAVSNIQLYEEKNGKVVPVSCE